MVRVREQVPLAEYTTLRLGGPARRFVEAATEEEIVAAVRACDEPGEPLLVLGGGSNLVVADQGFPGTVIRVGSTGLRGGDVAADGGGAGTVAVVVAAGEDWDAVVAWSVSEGLAGLECLAGIPGLAGATPIQNVGAYGQEVAETITTVRAYDRKRREIAELPGADCGFGYRTSAFKRQAHAAAQAAAGAGAARGGVARARPHVARSSAAQSGAGGPGACGARPPQAAAPQVSAPQAGSGASRIGAPQAGISGASATRVGAPQAGVPGASAPQAGVPGAGAARVSGAGADASGADASGAGASGAGASGAGASGAGAPQAGVLGAGAAGVSGAGADASGAGVLGAGAARVSGAGAGAPEVGASQVGASGAGASGAGASGAGASQAGASQASVARAGAPQAEDFPVAPASAATGRFVVLGVTFRLRRSTLSEPVRYRELALALGIDEGGRAPLADVRTAVLGLRRAKGMVLDAADPDTCSAGSFFVNPVLGQEQFAALERTVAATLGPGVAIPRFPAEAGKVKVSAAWLIEQAGFTRGYTGPGATNGCGPRISAKHTLALVNPGGATAASLVALARQVRDGVRGRFGVDLMPEPVLVGTAL